MRRIRYVSRSASLKERLFFRRNIDPVTNCWLWTGFLSHGYGGLEYKGKNCLVHRLSYELFVGPIKDLVLHKQICLNKNCFNPDHLYDGDRCDNRHDILELGMDGNKKKTHCPQGHEYTLENTRYWNTSRHCRECQKLRDEIVRMNKDAFRCSEIAG